MVKVLFGMGFSVPGQPYSSWTDDERHTLKDDVFEAIRSHFDESELNSWDNTQITNPSDEAEIRDAIDEVLDTKDPLRASDDPTQISYVYYNNTRYCIHSYDLKIEVGGMERYWRVAGTGSTGNLQAQLHAAVAWDTSPAYVEDEGEGGVGEIGLELRNLLRPFVRRVEGLEKKTSRLEALDGKHFDELRRIRRLLERQRSHRHA